LFELLLDYKANPNGSSVEGWLPVVHAMNKKLMAYVLALINARAELNVYGADGMTPLHAATQTQNLVGLKTLLDGSASPDMVRPSVFRFFRFQGHAF
jgi:ankyrin repeat protein